MVNAPPTSKSPPIVAESALNDPVTVTPESVVVNFVLLLNLKVTAPPERKEAAVSV